MLKSSVLTALAAMALGGQSTAQEVTQVDDVVVSARSQDELMRDFIEDIAPPEHSLQTARFYREVCVGGINLNPAAAQAIADRVSQNALDVGLEPGQPGCRPNILVVATNDGNALAKGLVERKRRFFDPGGSGMTRSNQALNRFTDGSQAIRWWHVATPVDARTGQRAARLPGEQAPVVTGGASRLRTELRHDIDRVMVVLDLSKLEDLNFTQVSDYVSMVSFAQVDDAADFSGYPSVLTLLAGNPEVRGLTEWDREYLTSLYNARLNQPIRLQQQNEMMSLIRQARDKAHATEPSD